MNHNVLIVSLILVIAVALAGLYRVDNSGLMIVKVVIVIAVVLAGIGFGKYLAGV